MCLTPSTSSTIRCMPELCMQLHATAMQNDVAQQWLCLIVDALAPGQAVCVMHILHPMVHLRLHHATQSDHTVHIAGIKPVFGLVLSLYLTINSCSVPGLYLSSAVLCRMRCQGLPSSLGCTNGGATE